MAQEIDLLVNYPRSKRDIEARGQKKTEADRIVARQFGEAFFDGERSHGYGGFYYDPRFWTPVVPTFQEHFNLTSNSKVLDVGCAKGFMMHDINRAISGITVKGVDISGYAIANGLEEMRPHMIAADCKELPFKEKEFDVAISINTIHNLEKDDCAVALQELERVAHRSFITVDAYRNELEKEKMYAWNLTAKTIMSADDWIDFFKEVGYTGDYYWFVP
jgi:SAM-dependent methyltransferase